MTALLAWLWPYLAAAGAVIAGIAGTYFKGRSDGRSKSEAATDKAAIQAERKREEIEDDIAQDDDLARRARDAGLVRRH